MSGSAPKRRRRRPEAAEREILDAAGRLLASHPSDEVTVGAIMEATTLSRKSFYVYFRDRNALLERLAAELAAQRDAVIAPLLEPGADLAALGRDTLIGLARLYVDHGGALRALAEASNGDPGARQAWRDFLDPIVDAHEQMIAAEIEAGRVTGLDARLTAQALIGMNLQFFFDQLVDAPDPDVEAAADALFQIWARTLYGSA